MKNILNCLYFNIDFLEIKILTVKGLSFFKELNWDIDQDNSSNGYLILEDLWLTYRKAKTKSNGELLIFSTSVDGIVFDIFAIIKGDRRGNIKTSDKFVFYSTWFTLEYHKKFKFTILDFYKKYLKNCYNGLNRLDICLDVSNSVFFLIDNFFKKDFKFFSTLGNDNKNPMFAQTYYIKNPQSSKNRDYIFRIYDKIEDSFKKHKSFLFPYLNDYDEVRRIELEMRPHSCQRILQPLENILQNKNNIVNDIFSTFLLKYLNEKYKEKIELEIKNLVLAKNKSRAKKDLSDFFLKTKHIPRRYSSVGHGYIKKVYEAGGFPSLFEFITNTLYEVDGELSLSTKPNFCYKLFQGFLDFLGRNPIYEMRYINAMLVDFQKRHNLKSAKTVKLKNPKKLNKKR